MMKKITKEIDEKAYYSILFSFYQNLLTPKQREIFVFYYDEDYSLKEIADDAKVSRSAIFDSLKKTTKVLDEYEEALGLYQEALKVSSTMNELKSHVDEEGLKIIEEFELDEEKEE